MTETTPQTESPTHWPHTGAILVGGKATRMGEPKHDLSLPGGSSFGEHIVGELSKVCRQVLVVGPAAILPGYEHVHDLRENVGPLGGIEALLASDIDEQYLLCPCDLPLIDSSILKSLLPNSTTLATVIHIEDEDLPRPLPARIAATALPGVQTMLDCNQRAVWQLLERITVQRIATPRSAKRLLRNVNTHQEYAEIARELSEQNG